MKKIKLSDEAKIMFKLSNELKGDFEKYCNKKETTFSMELRRMIKEELKKGEK